MSFLDGLQRAFSESKPLDQNPKKYQNPAFGGSNEGFEDIGDIGPILSPAKIPLTTTPDQVQETPPKVAPDDGPTPEQITHARRMLVVCSDMPKGCTVHCWYCSRCKKARTCTAWRHLRSHVEFFRQSEIPYSALAIEETEGRGVIQ